MSLLRKYTASFDVHTLQALQEKNQTILFCPEQTFDTHQIQDAKITTSVNFSDETEMQNIIITRIKLPFVDDAIDLFDAINDSLGDTRIVDQVSITTGRDLLGEHPDVPHIFIFVSHENNCIATYSFFERLFMVVQIIMCMSCVYNYYREDLLKF